MIAIIDYGVGNLRSVEKAFAHLGFPAFITANPKEVLAAERVVLPGVGAFGKSMESLERAEMVPVVRKIIASGRPFLGICLGLQLLFDESAEVFGGRETSFKGLGIFSGKVLRFPAGDLKVPQIGWNQLRIAKESPFLQGVPDGSYTYFVHSYYVKPQDKSIVACTTQYGIEYCSGIVRDNLAAFQFHPEKSSVVGLKILRNFAEIKG
jgi:glutamine amidotransferase